MNNSELLDFTAGMNTVVAPHLLPLNEAIQLTNVDIKHGSLESISELDNITNALGAYFIEYRRQLYYYDNWRSNALIDDKLYWADGLNTGKILPDGRELPLGIPTPTEPLTQDTAGNAGDGVHKGDFKYTYTFYSSTTGVESAPARLPSYVTADEQNIVLDTFETLPTQADSYRLYRIGGYLARFTLVATINVGDLPYTDSIDDTLIDGRLLQTLRTHEPPVGITNFVELNGRLFGSINNKLYFSGLGNPDAWYTDDFFNLPDLIVGTAKTPAGVLVFGSSYVYLLFGAAPSSFRVKVVSDYLGCISNKSIAYYNDKVIWLGKDGIFISDGYNIENLTYRKIEKVSNFSSTSAIVVNNVYYLSVRPTLVPSKTLFPAEDLFPGATQGAGVDVEEGIIALDFRRGQGYSFSFLEHVDTVSLGIYKGELYIIRSLTTEYIQCDQTFPCDEVFCYGFNTLAKLDGTLDDGYKELKYISPELIDGSFSTLKEYDKVRINFIGKFTVTIIFSNRNAPILTEIESGSLITNHRDIDSAIEGNVIIGIPNKNNKSYSIQFIITGKGILRSIQYSWKNRELP